MNSENILAGSLQGSGTVVQNLEENSIIHLESKVKEYFNVITITTLKQISKEYNVPYLKLIYIWNKMNTEYSIGNKESQK